MKKLKFFLLKVLPHGSNLCDQTPSNFITFLLWRLPENCLIKQIWSVWDQLKGMASNKKYIFLTWLAVSASWSNRILLTTSDWQDVFSLFNFGEFLVNWEPDEFWDCGSSLSWESVVWVTFLVFGLLAESRDGLSLGDTKGVPGVPSEHCRCCPGEAAS